MLAIPEEFRATIQREARRELWRHRKVWPLLEVYLDRDQLADARLFFAGRDVDRAQLPAAGWYDDIARQRGKSWKWCVIAVAWAHCHKGQFIKYAAQLGVSVRQIIVPTINKLVLDMPPELRPLEDRVDHVWRFMKDSGEPSEIKAAGVNLGHYDDLRGPKSHLVIEDEAAFYDEFAKVQEVVGPQLQTTNGVKVFATTPPYSTAHPVEAVCQAMKALGRYSHRTINGHPRMSTEEIQQHLAKEAGERGQTLEAFKLSSYYRREYLCMHVVETSRAVVPEWSDAAGAGHAEGATWGDVHTAALERPLFYDAYDSLDIGFARDPSAWLGGYWDWSNARFVVEAETPPLHRTRADALAAAILEQRRAMWPVSGPRPSGEAKRSPCETYWLPYGSYGDGSGNGAEKLRELAEEGLHFLHAAKVDLEARVNNVRTLAAQGKLWVHPRCTNLRKQLTMGLWAGTLQRVDFERSEDGHLDHLAALVDLVGHIDRQRRPVPVDWGADLHNTVRVQDTRPYGSVRNLDSALGEIRWD